MDLAEAFKYGPVYLDRIRTMTSYPFWPNVMDSMALLQNNICYKSREVILTTPLWFSNIFKMPVNRKWHDKGIMVVGDLPDGIYNVQPLESINET